MRHPSAKDFLVRVGGFFLIVAMAVLATKALFPGYEAVTILALSGVVLVATILQSLLPKIRKDKSKGDKKSKGPGSN